MPVGNDTEHSATRGQHESPGKALRADAAAEVTALLAHWVGPENDMSRADVVVAMEKRRRLLLRREELDRDPRAPTAHVEKELEAQVAATRELLNSFMLRGLERRIGYRLNLADRFVLNQLLKFGSDPPGGGVAVCRDCMYVFRPLRKSSARRCEKCERDGKVDAENSLDRHTVPHMEWDRNPLYHDDARFGGWSVRHMLRCSECGHLFGASMRNAKTCSGKCKTARSRRRGAGDTEEFSAAAKAFRAESNRIGELLQVAE